MTQQILTHQFDNGLTLLAEPMPWLESAAFALLTPAGCIRDPIDRLGVSNFTCDMVLRGCGKRNSREFVEDLELLGVHDSQSVTTSHTRFVAAMPHRALPDALSIFADVVQRPHLPANQIEEARMVCLQELRSVEDELPQKTMQELRRRFYGDPYGRRSLGLIETIEKVTYDDVKQLFENNYRPDGAILAVAGKVDWPRLRDHVAEIFGGWESRPLPAIAEKAVDKDYHHIQHDSSQTHIAVAYPSAAYSHPDYYQARGAVGVLSDGMSSRLFTEVREKRGLCYTVSASCHSLRDRGSVIAYAGTTTERAQETLDVLIEELVRLADGIEDAELNRLKARIKSMLIMQQESSASRAISIAGDWYYLDRVRTLDELGRIIDGLTCDSINQYLQANPPRDFTIVTLGSQKLEAKFAVP